MGVCNYLIEGVSGTGKTSVATELERRGFHVVHGDRVLAYQGDPETGARVQVPADTTLAWQHCHHIWNFDQVRALASDQRQPATFFCGGSRNWRQFIDLFDQVFVLHLNRETLNRRLMHRPADEFGGKPDERAFVLDLQATEQDIPPGIHIDAALPLGQVVDIILQHCA